MVVNCLIIKCYTIKYQREVLINPVIVTCVAYMKLGRNQRFLTVKYV